MSSVLSGHTIIKINLVWWKWPDIHHSQLIGWKYDCMMSDQILEYVQPFFLQNTRTLCPCMGKLFKNTESMFQFGEQQFHLNNKCWRDRCTAQVWRLSSNAIRMHYTPSCCMHLQSSICLWLGNGGNMACCWQKLGWWHWLINHDINTDDINNTGDVNWWQYIVPPDAVF